MNETLSDPKPLVSVIVPVYNVKEFLGKCVESIMSQTYARLEILLIDDGSSDGSESICDSYAGSTGNISVFHQENAGLSAARNTGIEKANGEYLLFVDSDDWIDADTVEQAVEKAQEYNADVVIWSYLREYPGRSLKRDVLPAVPTLYSGEDYRELYLSVVGPHGEKLSRPENLDVLSTAWNKLYKRSVIGALRFEDTKEIGTEDLLFNIGYFKNAYSAVYIDRYFLHYRKSGKPTLSNTYQEQFVRKRLNLYSKISEVIGESDKEVLDCYYNRIAMDILGQTLVELFSGEKMSVMSRRLKKNVLNNSLYEYSLSRLDISKMPVHWKLFYFFGKKKNAFMLLVMGKMIGFLRTRL